MGMQKFTDQWSPVYMQIDHILHMFDSSFSCSRIFVSVEWHSEIQVSHEVKLSLLEYVSILRHKEYEDH